MIQHGQRTVTSRRRGNIHPDPTPLRKYPCQGYPCQGYPCQGYFRSPYLSIYSALLLGKGAAASGSRSPPPIALIAPSAIDYSQ
ncbi:hypothetical protein Ae717Ps2_6471 [Pseudonocardia sp. Ae717_Ps2]|nr:hypothetical protein Ae717Ps2_6471 [Pseudonocardia sp. Ae717_Ps2]